MDKCRVTPHNKISYQVVILKSTVVSERVCMQDFFGFAKYIIFVILVVNKFGYLCLNSIYFWCLFFYMMILDILEYIFGPFFLLISKIGKELFKLLITLQIKNRF